MKTLFNQKWKLALLALLVSWITLPLAHAAGDWSPTGSTNYYRYGGEYTATLLATGKVLLTGSSTVPNAELYDPATGAWTNTGSMSFPRKSPTATLLANGKVLVTGGAVNISGENHRRDAELYDPVAGTWSPTGSMMSPRVSHTATLLANGKVLVVGGKSYGSIYYSLNSAELYDPATGTWT